MTRTRKSKPVTTIEVSDFRDGTYLSKYKDDMPEKIKNMALLGFTILQIAHVFEVTEKTVMLWISTKPECRDAYEHGKFHSDIDVQMALRSRAVGYSYTEVKNIEGLDNVGRPYSYTTTTVKQVVPDTTAQIFWLKNRNPERWRDVNRDISTNITNIDMSKTLNLENVSTEEQKLLRSIAIKQISNMNNVDGS